MWRNDFTKSRIDLKQFESKGSKINKRVFVFSSKIFHEVNRFASVIYHRSVYTKSHDEQQIGYRLLVAHVPRIDRTMRCWQSAKLDLSLLVPGREPPSRFRSTNVANYAARNLHADIEKSLERTLEIFERMSRSPLATSLAKSFRNKRLLK